MGDFLKPIVVVSILLALLSLTNYYRSKDDDTAALNKKAATSPFFLAHVLDPSVDGYRYTSWGTKEWLEWLNQREALHKKANPHKFRTPLPSKGLNSVLIATPSQVINAFAGQPKPYSESGGPKNTLWGDTRFLSYIFVKHGINSFRIYKCPPFYVALKFEKGMPVHFHEHATRPARGNRVNPSKDCELVKDGK